MWLYAMRPLVASCRWLFVFTVALALISLAPNHRLGQPCRVVEQTVTIAGEAVQAMGTLCRRIGGRWILAR
jgi:surface antigen